MPTNPDLGNLAQHLVYQNLQQYNFDGSGANPVDVAHHDSLSLVSGTISLKFSLDKLFGKMALVSKDLDGNGEGQFTVWAENGQLIVTMEDGSGGREWLRVPDLILDDGQDYALSVSFGEDGLMIWLDGQLVAAEPEFKVGLAANDASLVIGGTRHWRDADQDADGEMEGTVSDVMIFDEQLSSADVIKVTSVVAPDLGMTAHHAAQMAELAPTFQQLHDASDTFKDILAEYGVNEHGHLMTPLDVMKVGNGRENTFGSRGENAGLNGGKGDDYLNGRGGEDILQGGYGNDTLVGGNGNDILDGGHGEDTLRGGEGNDLLISRADAREPDVYYDADRDEGDPYNELTNGKLYPDQPIPADDVLEGGAGADIFYFQTLINAKDYIIEKHTREDGTINWHGVAGENDNIHDHWVDAIGNDVVLDYSRAEGDRIVIEGHTTQISSITYGDADGDGVMDHSIISLYSDQGSGGGAHNDDLLGTITVYGDLITQADIEHDAGPAYGIVYTINDLDEAVTPLSVSTDTGDIAPPTTLQDLNHLGLPDRLTPVFAVSGEHHIDGSDGSYMEAGHHDSLSLVSGTISLKFSLDKLFGKMALVSKDLDGNGEGQFTVWAENGQLIVTMEDGSGGREWLRVPDLILDDGQDYALSVSFGEDGLMIWLDGQLVAAEPEFKVGLAANDASLVIGGTRHWRDADQDADGEMEGTVSDVMIFDEQLSSADVIKVTSVVAPDLGMTAHHAAQMAELAPTFQQLHDASDTFKDILAEYGVNEHGHLMTPLDVMKVGNGRENTFGSRGENAGLNGGKGDDYLNGRGGEDILQGGYGNDTLVGGNGNDILDGGHGEDTLRGGEGNDLLISRADAREPDVYYDADRDEGDPYNELTNGKLYPDQPIPADDVLEGGAGADIFYFQTLINAKDYIIEKHTREDGTINWHGVAGENDNIHDHWVDAIGNDVVLDYSRAEGDRIVIEGHTTQISSITYGDADGDGVMDHSIISLYSDQGSGGGAHNDDLLGTITVYGDLITQADIEHDAGPAYGIVYTINDLDEAVTPLSVSTDTGDIAPPTTLQDLNHLNLPGHLNPVFAMTGTHSFTPDDRAPMVVGHSNALSLSNGTIAFGFALNSVGVFQTLLSKDASGLGQGGHLSIYVNENGALQVRIQDEVESHHITIDDAVVAGEWYDLAVSFGADGLRVYQNGALVGYDSDVTVGLDTNTEYMVIGANNWSSATGETDRINAHLDGQISDVVIFDTQETGDTIFGDGPRDDYAYFDARAQDATFEVAGNGVDIVVTVDGAATTLGSDQDFVEFRNLTVRTSDIEFGTSGADSILGGDTADVILGGAGNDTLRGYDNDDLIFGGLDDDYVSGGKGDDILMGGVGDDTVYGGDGMDMLMGGADDDQIFGGAGRDQLYGGLGDDTLYGMSWSDEGTSTKDKAFFDGDFADFTFETTSWWNSARNERIDVLIVQDSASGGADGFYEGKDYLVDIDQLVFGDVSVSFDDLI